MLHKLTHDILVENDFTSVGEFPFGDEGLAYTRTYKNYTIIVDNSTESTKVTLLCPTTSSGVYTTHTQSIDTVEDFNRMMVAHNVSFNLSVSDKFDDIYMYLLEAIDKNMRSIKFFPKACHTLYFMVDDYLYRCRETDYSTCKLGEDKLSFAYVDPETKETVELFGANDFETYFNFITNYFKHTF